MPLSDAEKQGLEVMLNALDDEKLANVRDRAQNALRILQDANSEYPATKEFLRARGLSSVAELDDAGVEELMAHLKATLLNIVN